MRPRKFRITWMLLSTAAVIVASAFMFISSCNKDSKVEPLTITTNSGTDVIDMASGSTWTIDKAHSNVGWETFYYGSNALLTGRFNNFWVDVHFDQANPENTVINAWVQLSTFNTGEPGRDAAGKCGPTYMGVHWNVDTVPNPDVYTVIPSSDTARFSSGTTERYGTGYVTHGTLAFRGLEKPVDLYFQYEGITEYPSSTGGASTYRTGFIGQFDMNANTVFGVNSTSIADLVTVKINVNAKKN